MSKGGKVYRLAQNKTPLTFMLQVKDKRSSSLLYFDEKANEGRGEQRALRYAPNQKSIFLDEQDDNARLGLIIFKDGTLVVGDREPQLHKFLEHHPGNTANEGGGIFYEVNHEAEHAKDIELMDYEFEAQQIAREMSVNDMVKLIRKINPSKVDRMETSELKRDTKVFARNDPHKFMSLVEVSSGDDSVMNTIVDAVEDKIIQMRPAKREVYWTTEEKKNRMFKAPEGEDLEEAFVIYLMSNEGLKDLEEIKSILG